MSKYLLKTIFKGLLESFISNSAQNIFLFYRIFGHEGDKAEKVLFCNWLDMLYKGIGTLKMYEPKTESWLQVCASLFVFLL